MHLRDNRLIFFLLLLDLEAAMSSRDRILTMGGGVAELILMLVENCWAGLAGLFLEDAGLAGLDDSLRLASSASFSASSLL